jgi:molecular chaperone HtpG
LDTKRLRLLDTQRQVAILRGLLSAHERGVCPAATESSGIVADAARVRGAAGSAVGRHPTFKLQVEIMSEPTVRPFKAEVSQILNLVVNSLYSNTEVFVRELISNASDALDKLRFESLKRPELLPADEALVVRVTPDPEKSTLTFWDNGIGMSASELEDNLGTIARSGTKQFVEALQAAQRADRPALIGQFGVGFYSAYLVADRVEVTSRAAGSTEAFRWESDAKETFSIEPGERDVQGTTVTLHLKPEHKEFLEPFRLRRLIERYSDYIPHAIELEKREGKSGEPAEPTFERVNQASALWRRSSKDVTKEQYEEFYKHLTHDWEPPLAYRHFQVEGKQLFFALLFIPKRAPFDLFEVESKHGVRLHVRRVFVMDNCTDLVPRYLRFVRGVVDSEDLPLNVSRELLQDSAAVRVIKKQLVNHTLTAIEQLKENDKERYAEFWTAYGVVLKEGLHLDASERSRIAKLVQFHSSTTDGFTGFADYVSRMKPEQKAIYYAAGASRDLLHKSPHLEELRKRGYEVLYMTDPIDPFALESVPEFEGTPLVNAMTSELKLDPAEQGESEAKPAEGAEALLARMKEVLTEKVDEVRTSQRLTDSPVCLVIPEGGLAPHIEQLLRARKMSVPPSKRILEVNTRHPVIENLARAVAAHSEGGQVSSWIRTLYDQALIAEGSPVDDPADFARRLTDLVQRASTGAAP